MKFINSLQFIFLIGCAACLCTRCNGKDEVEFPDEPYIEFRGFKFVDVEGVANPDTLKFSIYFRDGDFDLGLKGTEQGPPYNLYNYYLKDGTVAPSFQLDQVKSMIIFSDKKTINPDTLPSFDYPFNCTNWEIVRDDNYMVLDTVYRTINPGGLNFMFDFYLSEGNGPFEKMITCTRGFNGRFEKPFQNKPGSPFQFRKISDREGILIFSIASSSIKSYFKGKNIKSKIKIKDRALNSSNEVETDIFTLD